MGIYFGTDGLRGKAIDELTFSLAYKVGNALSVLKRNPKIIIGADTRVSNAYFTLAVASGAMSGGGSVTDVGIAPTACVAYLTKELKADYGVVISASHNSGEYNGIKIFDSNGYKISDSEEERIEKCFVREKINSFVNIGGYKQDYDLKKRYVEFLVEAAEGITLKNKTFVLDCANGAAYKIAPEVFKKLGAKVICISNKADGLMINDGCGALHTENLIKTVLRRNADAGFGFDGDADRLIAVDEKGNVIDGDQILTGLALDMKEHGALNGSAVVGTRHTNMGIEMTLGRENVRLIRANIGDKHVLAELIKNGYSLGGEQSGHIIFNRLHTTGDGIFTAVKAACLITKKNIKFSEIFGFNKYPQTNTDVTVFDKAKIVCNDELAAAIKKCEEQVRDVGRVMVRASGTEPKIRITVESENEKENKTLSAFLVDVVRKIDGKLKT